MEWAEDLLENVKDAREEIYSPHYRVTDNDWMQFGQWWSKVTMVGRKIRKKA